jgi:DNA-binding HxlR family transcriptional regulator
MVTIKRKGPVLLSHTCSAQELEDALRVLEGRWKTLIIYHLFTAPVLRFSDLRRAVEGISQKMLIQQLRDLEENGVIFRKVYPVVPPKVEYGLTKDGLALRPVLQALQTWAQSRSS